MHSNTKLTREAVIDRFNSVHGQGTWDYSDVEYNGMSKKVKIICHEHGAWWQLPTNHLKGKGCPFCAGVRVSKHLPIDTIVPKGSVAIPLTRGGVSIVDEDDADRVLRYNWVLTPTGYAMGVVDGKHIFMHRFIMGVTDRKMVVDHIFHNTLDNRKSQLRVCTQKGNNQNARSVGDFSSKYKGVCWDKSRNKWTVNITVDGKYKSCGRFDDELEAARAYDEAAKKYHKDFARLNFPEQK